MLTVLFLWIYVGEGCVLDPGSNVCQEMLHFRNIAYLDIIVVCGHLIESKLFISLME